MGAIVDRLTVSLEDARNFLRVSPDLHSNLTADALSLATQITVRDPTLFSPGQLLTVVRETHRIAAINYVSGAVTLESGLVNSYSAEAPVHAFTDDEIIADLIQGAKEAADEYVNNPFVDSLGQPQPIPADIRNWVLRKVGRDYERRVTGLLQESVTGSSAKSYADNSDDSAFLDLDRWRLHPH